MENIAKTGQLKNVEQVSSHYTKYYELVKDREKIAPNTKQVVIKPQVQNQTLGIL